MPEPSLARGPDPEGPAATEWRASARVPHAAGPVVSYLVRPGLEVGRAVLQNLSADGAALVVEVPAAEGAVLLIQLGGPQRPGASHTRLARVARTKSRGPGAWLVRCRFTPPLSNDELASLRREMGLDQESHPPRPGCR
jgi:hypothetical protein